MSPIPGIIAVLSTIISVSAGCAIDELDDAEHIAFLEAVGADEVTAILCDFSLPDQTVDEPTGAPYQVVSCGLYPAGNHDICHHIEVISSIGLATVYHGTFIQGDRITGWRLGIKPTGLCWDASGNTRPWLVRLIMAE